MTHYGHNNVHEFFKNKELNHFYIAIALMTFGEALIAIFVPIYLYNLGHSIPKILFFYFIMSLSWPILAYPAAKIVSKIGVKHSFILSVPFIVIYYAGLYYLQTAEWMFYVAPVFFTCSKTLYNFSYHLNFAKHSDRKNRGTEVSIVGIVGIGIHILAPLLGAIIASYNFLMLYIVGTIIIFLGIIPLFLTREEHEEIKFSIKELFNNQFNKSELKNNISFIGYGVESSIGGIIWPIFLILILVSITKTGVVIMASAALSVILFYIIGRFSDKYDKVKMIRIGSIMHFFAWIGRIFVDSPIGVFIVDTYRNVSEKVVQVPWSAHGYDIAMKKDYFKYIVSRELMFAFSRIIIQPVLILIFLYTSNPFLISFVIGAIFTLGYGFMKRS